MEFFNLEVLDGIQLTGDESRITLSLFIIFYAMGTAVSNCFKTIISPVNIARSLASKMEILQLPKFHTREISAELAEDYYRRIAGPEGFTPILKYFFYFPVIVFGIGIMATFVLTLQQFRVFCSYTSLFVSLIFLGFVLLADSYSERLR